MDYFAVVRRSTQETRGNECRHGLDAKFCGYCNGNYFVKKSEARKIDENEELRFKYEQIKEHFKHFREIWTEDEILVVYDDFKSANKKELKRLSYLTAIKLERTTKEVLWMYLHLFSEKKLHRGKAVEEVRKVFGLDKGGENVTT